MKHSIFLLVILALNLKPSLPTCAAGGDCLYNCEGSTCYGFSNKTQTCQDIRGKCEARCAGRRWWGAIAYSTTDHQSGYAFEYNDLNDAKKNAMAHCVAANGKACKVWAYFENECGAIAADGNLTSWGTGPDRKTAERFALQGCSGQGGRSCKVEVWTCSKMN